MRTKEETIIGQTDPMVRPEVVNLLIPARRPEIFTNKLDAFECLEKVWFSVAQSTINAHDGMRRTRVERMYVPFGNIRANVHPNCL
jgi:hypothetical protein